MPRASRNHSVHEGFVRLGDALPSTIHFVSVHLHPFAESLQLRDKTTGETVLASKAENRPERIGLARVDQIASPSGIRLHKDHEYELVSAYNNTTSQNRTAMAVMYLYVEDTEYRRR